MGASRGSKNSPRRAPSNFGRPFFSISAKKARISGPAEAQNQLFSFLTHLGVPWEPLGAVLGVLVPDGPSWTNSSRIDRIFQAWVPIVKAAGGFSTSFRHFKTARHCTMERHCKIERHSKIEGKGQEAEEKFCKIRHSKFRFFGGPLTNVIHSAYAHARTRHRDGAERTKSRRTIGNYSLFTCAVGAPNAGCPCDAVSH